MRNLVQPYRQSERHGSKSQRTNEFPNIVFAIAWYRANGFIDLSAAYSSASAPRVRIALDWQIFPMEIQRTLSVSQYCIILPFPFPSQPAAQETEDF